MMKSIIAFVAFILITATVVFASPNPTVDELCEIYQQKIKEDFYFERQRAVQIIVNSCRLFTKDVLNAKTQPTYNFRRINSLKIWWENIFRGGQPAPTEETEEILKHFRKYHLGFFFNHIKMKWNVDTVINLRFDPTFQSFENTFGKTIPQLPISKGEAIFSYAMEKKQVEELAIKSIYAPTLPEMEHFVGNYVPRLDNGPDSKPYVCRLPQGIPDGAPLHWLNDHQKFVETNDERPILVSAFEDCHDLYEQYGKEQMEKWVQEVRRVSHVANQIFLQLADFILTESQQDAQQDAKRIFFHCSSGSDRVGRLSAILELRKYGITQEEIKAYTGVLSNPRIDLIVLNYLLSQRAGSDVQFRYIFPDLKNTEKSWLWKAFEPRDNTLEIPYLKQFSQF